MTSDEPSIGVAAIRNTGTKSSLQGHRNPAEASKLKNLQGRTMHTADSDGFEPRKPDETSRWHKEFLRRDDKAFAGRYQPMVHELILRMSLFRGRVDVDAGAFTERLIGRVITNGLEQIPEVDRLRAVKSSPIGATFLSASAALEQTCSVNAGRQLSCLAEVSARFDYYAAIMGCQTGAFRVAGHALICALDEELPNCARSSLLEAALGWLMWAASKLPSAHGRLDAITEATPESYATEAGREIAMLIEILKEP